jgi:hypothetical protein
MRNKNLEFLTNKVREDPSMRTCRRYRLEHRKDQYKEWVEKRKYSKVY